MTIAHARYSDGSSDRYIRCPTLNEAFWKESNEVILRDLATQKEGLTGAEAERRLVRYGPNLSVLNIRRSLISKFRQAHRGAADCHSSHRRIDIRRGGRLAEPYRYCLDCPVLHRTRVFQEQKAENTVEALRRSVAVTASVLRDGRHVELAVREIVPGDVVELRAGDLVPADGIVLRSRGALANEAILTGEPYPAEKRCGPCDAKSPVDAFNALFSGTSLVGGEAVMLVVATGGATRFGALQLRFRTRSRRQRSNAACMHLACSFCA